jgi:Protein of unknown function (DUF1501)
VSRSAAPKHRPANRARLDPICANARAPWTPRGLLSETLVACLGEFGRSPERGVSTSGNNNNTADGRDHWLYCYTNIIGGAGIKRGYVHGESDKTASGPKPERLS